MIIPSSLSLTTAFCIFCWTKAALGHQALLSFSPALVLLSLILSSKVCEKNAIWCWWHDAWYHLLMLFMMFLWIWNLLVHARFKGGLCMFSMLFSQSADASDSSASHQTWRIKLQLVCKPQQLFSLFVSCLQLSFLVQASLLGWADDSQSFLNL